MIKTDEEIRAEHAACVDHDQTKYGICRLCGHGDACRVCPHPSANGARP